MSEKKKRIGILIPNGYWARNFLRHDFLARMHKEGVELLLISPLAKDEKFRKIYGKHFVKIVEPAPLPALARKYANFLNRLFQGSSSISSYKHLLKEGVVRSGGEERWIDRFPHTPFARSLFSFLQKRNIRLLLNSLFLGGRQYRSLIESLDLLLDTHPFNCEHLPFVVEATRQSCKRIAMIISWDNITTKGHIAGDYDVILLWNDIVRDEVLRYYPEQFNAESAVSTGVPNFDAYFQRDIEEKKRFAESINWQEGEKLVTFTTTPHRLSWDEESYIEQIWKHLKEKSSPFRLHVRLHPLDSIDRYQHLFGYSEISFDEPEKQEVFSDGWWNPDGNGTRHLAATLFYSDLVINVFSTISLEAALFDTPVINICYDVTGREYEQSVTRYPDFEHYRKVIETGAVKLVYSEQELKQAIDFYLEHPEAERKERKILTEKQCKYTDGKSLERITNILLETVSGKNKV